MPISHSGLLFWATLCTSVRQTGSRRTCQFSFRLVAKSRPAEYDDAGNVDPLAEIDHPRRRFDVEVVEHGARLQRSVDDAVDGTRRVTVFPPRSNVSLHLTTVADPRLFVVRQVLHCSIASNSSTSPAIHQTVSLESLTYIFNFTF